MRNQANKLRESMGRRLAAAAVLAALGAVGPAAEARDIYVNNVAGDDLFDGTAAESVDRGRGPYQTLRRALRDARAGDRIVLANTGEPYRESVSLVGSRNSGTQSTPFVIEGSGAVLDGSVPVPAGAWELAGNNLFRFRPAQKAFQTLYWDGRPAPRKEYSPAFRGRPHLAPTQWAAIDGWIYFGVEEGKLPDHYALSYAALPVGLTLYKTSHVMVTNLTIQGYARDGINLNDAAGPCVVGGVTARGNGRSGMAVCGASDVRAEACLIGDNGQCQVLVEGYSELALDRCELVGKAPKWEAASTSRLVVDGQPASTP